MVAHTETFFDITKITSQNVLGGHFRWEISHAVAKSVLTLTSRFASNSQNSTWSKWGVRKSMKVTDPVDTLNHCSPLHSIFAAPAPCVSLFFILLVCLVFVLVDYCFDYLPFAFRDWYVSIEALNFASDTHTCIVHTSLKHSKWSHQVSNVWVSNVWTCAL